ncbi:MAG TPA: hypothetical protein VGC95_04110, partial [Chitinophagaceae bacterium]
ATPCLSGCLQIVLIFCLPFCFAQSSNGRCREEIWTNATARFAAKNELARLRRDQTAFFAVAALVLICNQISSNASPLFDRLWGCKKGFVVCMGSLL